MTFPEFLQNPSIKNFTRLFKGDRYIWGVIAFLTIVSLVAVYSGSGKNVIKYNSIFSPLIKSVVYIIIAWVVMYNVHKLKYRELKVSGIILLLLIVLIFLQGFISVMSITAGKTIRDISIPGIGFRIQPTDFTKLTLVAYLAHFLANKIHNLKQDVSEFNIPIAVSILVIGFLGIVNVSSALIMTVSVLFMFFLGQAPKLVFRRFFLVLLIAGAIGAVFSTRSDTVKNRIKSFGHTVAPKLIPPLNDTEKGSLRKQQEAQMQGDLAAAAIVQGGIFGKGPGNSEIKLLLPEAENDFIYAVIMEEYGVWGGFLVLLCYLIILFRVQLIIKNSRDPLGGLLAGGLAFVIVLQAFVNICVSVGLIPVTGQNLPFVSSGGTSLVAFAAAFGLILSISRDSEPPTMPQSNPSLGF